VLPPTNILPNLYPIFAYVANEFVTYSPARSSLTLSAVRAFQRSTTRQDPSPIVAKDLRLLLFLEIIIGLLHGHEIASLMILFLTPSYTQPSEASASPTSDEAAQSTRVHHFIKSSTPCPARPRRVKTRTLGISSNDVLENFIRDVTYM
jgi:hypothetical protein